MVRWTPLALATPPPAGPRAAASSGCSRPNWSAKAEYLYVDLSSNGATGGLGFNWGYYYHPEINVVRAGVNYHFNWGAPAPVIAKY